MGYKYNPFTGKLDVVPAAGGSFTGTMDDIANGATYVKTENNYSDTEKAKVDNIHQQILIKSLGA